MTETLTGKDALLAILEGTHKWETDDCVVWVDGGRWNWEWKNDRNWQVSTDEYTDIRVLLRHTWTRGEPVEQQQEKGNE